DADLVDLGAVEVGVLVELAHRLVPIVTGRGAVVDAATPLHLVSRLQDRGAGETGSQPEAEGEGGNGARGTMGHGRASLVVQVAAWAGCGLSPPLGWARVRSLRRRPGERKRAEGPRRWSPRAPSAPR